MTGLVAEKIVNLSVSRYEEVGQSDGLAISNQEANRLDAVLREFSTVTEIQAPQYEGNRYPTTNFPTGSNPDSINFEPTRINNDQAQTSPQNRNPITRDDVALKAGSERYQNAVKGITNLLTIIDQARANKLKAQNDLARYTQAYNTALKDQRDAQNAIITAEIKVKQIQSALAGANGKIGDLENRIAGLNKLGADLNRDKDNILGEINDGEQQRANLMARRNEINGRLGGLVDDVRAQQEKCQLANIDLSNANGDLAKKQEELANVTKNRIAAEKDVADKQRLVDDLRAKLDAAEGALADSKIRLNGLKNDEKVLPGVINELQKKINAFAESAEFCAIRVEDIKR